MYVLQHNTCNLYLTTVADVGFVEGGFCNSIAREKFGTTPIFERF